MISLRGVQIREQNLETISSSALSSRQFIFGQDVLDNPWSQESTTSFQPDICGDNCPDRFACWEASFESAWTHPSSQCLRNLLGERPSLSSGSELVEGRITGSFVSTSCEHRSTQNIYIGENWSQKRLKHINRVSSLERLIVLIGFLSFSFLPCNKKTVYRTVSISTLRWRIYWGGGNWFLNLSQNDGSAVSLSSGYHHLWCWLWMKLSPRKGKI